MSYRYEGNGKFTEDSKNGQKTDVHSSDPWADRPQQAKPRKSKSSDSDTESWFFIALAFFIFWPLGIFLLIRKLSDDGGRKKTESQPRAQQRSAPTDRSEAANDSVKSSGLGMKITGIVLAALGGLMVLGALAEIPYYVANAFWWELFSDFSLAAAFVSGGAALLWGSGQAKRRARRFAKYLAVAGGAQSVSIVRLAAAAEVPERRVERDLEVMVEQGLWGVGAYVDLSAGKLYRSAAAGAADYERRNAPETPPQAQEGYSGMLRQIRAANDRIADEALSIKIDRLEEIAARIFRLIENEPAKKAKAGTFLNYYLPTTQKLLDSYAEFEEAGVSGGNLSEAKRKIERTMDNIVQGFERQLDELYRADALDIDSDIRVMETMLRRDHGRVEDDFSVDGRRVQAEGGDAQDDFTAPDEGGSHF